MGLGAGEGGVLGCRLRDPGVGVGGRGKRRAVRDGGTAKGVSAPGMGQD